jgi:hypothetical protein
MCGPIAISLPSGSGPLHHITSRIFYNMGRIMTYALLGYAAGIAGKSVAIAGWQNALSISVGGIIVLAVVIPTKFLSRLFPGEVYAVVGNRFTTLWKAVFGCGTLSSMLAVGILNGFLPCGLVYVAVGASMVLFDPFQSVVYMVSFGLGTFPLMFAVSMAGQLFASSFRLRLSRLVPVGALILGCLLILRGMSLGIPYVSPADPIHATDSQTCH